MAGGLLANIFAMIVNIDITPYLHGYSNARNVTPESTFIYRIRQLIVGGSKKLKKFFATFVNVSIV